jgi:quinol monooxygenase YgiN
MVTYGRIGTLKSAPEDRDQLAAILTRAADLMADVAGCQLYVVSKDADDDTAVWVMELWDSQEAHAQSLTLPEVRALIAEAMPLLKGQPSGSALIPVGGKGP